MENYTFTPARSRVNFRLFLFLAVVAAPFIWGAYVGAEYLLNGGVTDLGDKKKVDLKALGFFNFDQRNGSINEVPAQFRKLDGERVVLEGFMYDPTSSVRVKNFQFVYNITKCCFSGPPLVQERVFANCAPGKSLPYSSAYVQLTGILHVKVVKNDVGEVTSVYTMDVERATELRG
jgi:hypothetical protein